VSDVPKSAWGLPVWSGGGQWERVADAVNDRPDANDEVAAVCDASGEHGVLDWNE
jgi:hypothetical protein